MDTALQAYGELERNKPKDRNNDGHKDNHIEDDFPATDAEDAFVEKQGTDLAEAKTSSTEKINSKLSLYRVSHITPGPCCQENKIAFYLGRTLQSRRNLLLREVVGGVAKYLEALAW